MNARRFAIAVVLRLLGLALALPWLAKAQPALADPAEWTVCPDGPPGCDFATIQDSVDTADDGDVIKIATGVYTDVHGRPVPPGYPYPPPGGVITQVIFISKTLTLQGGYPADFVDPPDPIANPTTLDAQGRGRVLIIAGNISPTVAGLCMTGGDAVNLNGSASEYYDAYWMQEALSGISCRCQAMVKNAQSQKMPIHLLQALCLVSGLNGTTGCKATRQEGITGRRTCKPVWPNHRMRPEPSHAHPPCRQCRVPPVQRASY
jgi:hypothetical protein